ncbi:ABC transporter ATP-binding protein [Clostridium perfringens]|uniref:ABC transporter ATP-binding protein n=1 Tax=Clostridium perfringens TaxID=1502 RepID=UPI0039E89C78
MKNYVLKNKFKFMIALVVNLLAGVISVLTAFIFKYIIDAAMNKNLSGLKYMTIFSVIYVIVFFTLEYLSKLTLASYSRSVMISLKEDLFTGIINKDIRDFVSKTTGDYLAIFQNDINILDEDYFKAMIYAGRDMISFGIAFISIFIINFKLSLGIIIISFMLLGISFLFGKSLSSSREKSASSIGKFMAKTKDLLGGYEVIKSFNVEFKAKDEFNQCNTYAEDCKYKFFVKSSAVGILTWNLGLLIFLIVMLIGGYFVIKGTILIGSLIAIVQLLNNILNPIGSIADKFNKFNSTKGIIERVNNNINEFKNGKSDGIDIRFNKDIVIEDLSFSYNGENYILKDINLTFNKGGKYVIIGESGSGKSTLLKIILNYYDNYIGKIIIDGISYKEINPQSIYENFSITQQNVFIFDGTVRENITLYQNYNDDEIERVINLAGLKKLIEKLPEGLNTKISENAKNISGGEAQRISIARALIKKTPILILDEATSALDKETSYAIEKQILNLKGVTCIIVTHKLRSEEFKNYDGVIKICNSRAELM